MIAGLTAPGKAIPEESKEEIPLGINCPISGPYLKQGLDQIRAARLAADEINRNGGIMGHRIKLIHRDSGSDVLRSVFNVRELIRDCGCRMIFGGSSSAVAIAVSEICQEYWIPFFATLTYSTETTMEKGHRVCFRECYDSWMAAQVMADWLNDRYSGKQYAYITADYSWGRTTENSFRTVTRTVDRTRHPGFLAPLGTTDFVQVLNQIAKSPPDVLVLALFGRDLSSALRQVRERELGKHALIVVPNLELGTAEHAGPNAIHGVVGALPWTWKVPYVYDYPRGKAFVEEYVRRYHRYPSSSGASAYTILYEYKSAVERAQSFKTSSVIRALEGHTYQLLKDPQTWRALDHQSVQTVFMVQGNHPNQVLSDPYRLDFFTIIHSIPGEKAVRSEAQWKSLREVSGLPPRLEELRIEN